MQIPGNIAKDAVLDLAGLRFNTSSRDASEARREVLRDHAFGKVVVEVRRLGHKHECTFTVGP